MFPTCPSLCACVRYSDRIRTSLNVLGDSFCHLAHQGAAPSSVYVSYRSVSLCVRALQRPHPDVAERARRLMTHHWAAQCSVYVSYLSVSLCVRCSDRIRTSLNVLGDS